MWMALAWPMWRYPLGSGGKRVTTLPPKRPERLCASMISRTKLEGRVSSVMGPIVSPRVRLGARLFPDRTEEALHGRDDGGQDHDREGEDEEPAGERAREQDVEVPVREKEGLAEGFLGHAPKHEGEHERRRLVAVLLHEEADDSEDQHHHDVPHVARFAVHPDDAEEQDE